MFKVTNGLTSSLSASLDLERLRRVEKRRFLKKGKGDSAPFHFHKAVKDSIDKDYVKCRK